LRDGRGGECSRDGQHRNQFFHIFLPFGDDICRKLRDEFLRGANSTTQGRQLVFRLRFKQLTSRPFCHSDESRLKRSNMAAFAFNQNVVLLQRDCR
jgi:hypothetical protein